MYQLWLILFSLVFLAPLRGSSSSSSSSSSASADPNFADSDGNTQLFYVARNSNQGADALCRLIDRGANIHHRNHAGENPLVHLALVITTNAIQEVGTRLIPEEISLLIPELENQFWKLSQLIGCGSKNIDTRWGSNLSVKEYIDLFLRRLLITGNNDLRQMCNNLWESALYNGFSYLRNMQQQDAAHLAFKNLGLRGLLTPSFFHGSPILQAIHEYAAIGAADPDCRIPHSLVLIPRIHSRHTDMPPPPPRAPRIKKRTFSGMSSVSSNPLATIGEQENDGVYPPFDDEGWTPIAQASLSPEADMKMGYNAYRMPTPPATTMVKYVGDQAHLSSGDTGGLFLSAEEIAENELMEKLFLQTPVPSRRPQTSAHATPSPTSSASSSRSASSSSSRESSTYEDDLSESPSKKQRTKK